MFYYNKHRKAVILHRRELNFLKQKSSVGTKADDFRAYNRIQKRYSPKTAHNTFFLILYEMGLEDKDVRTGVRLLEWDSVAHYIKKTTRTFEHRGEAWRVLVVQGTTIFGNSKEFSEKSLDRCPEKHYLF